jgi:hypothetical protein
LHRACAALVILPLAAHSGWFEEDDAVLFTGVAEFTIKRMEQDDMKASPSRAAPTLRPFTRRRCPAPRERGGQNAFSIGQRRRPLSRGGGPS